MIRTLSVLLLPIALFASTSANAGWKLIPANNIAKVDGITIKPNGDWNQAGSRPGKQGRIWTQDGVALNAIEIFSGVPNGAPLYRERSKKHNPMPKFNNSVLLPELADFFERSFRSSNQITNFSIVDSEPGEMAGGRALLVRYRYTLPNDELSRFGVARLAVIKGKLYVINFYAPKLHYFSSGLEAASKMMNSIAM